MQQIARRQLFGIGASLAAAPVFAATGPLLGVWQRRSDTGCLAWARLFHEAGFVVVVHEVDDLAAARLADRVPADLAACHTARVAGYTLEGHVPVEAVRRLLELRPAVLGLAVAGAGAARPHLIAFATDGGRSVFA